jgi:hypothetical protein
VKGKIIAGDLVIDGAGDTTGIATTTAAGVVIAASSLTVGIADKIAIPAKASINLGGSNGITLGSGTYKATTAATTLLLATGTAKPTLSIASGGSFLVAAAADDKGVLTVGSNSVILKNTSGTLFTASVVAGDAVVNIAAGATITNTTGNDGGITLTDGSLASRSGSAPGVNATTGLKLTSKVTTAGWETGTPAGVTS